MTLSNIDQESSNLISFQRYLPSSSSHLSIFQILSSDQKNEIDEEKDDENFLISFPSFSLPINNNNNLSSHLPSSHLPSSHSSSTKNNQFPVDINYLEQKRKKRNDQNERKNNEIENEMGDDGLISIIRRLQSTSSSSFSHHLPPLTTISTRSNLKYSYLGNESISCLLISLSYQQSNHISFSLISLSLSQAHLSSPFLIQQLKEVLKNCSNLELVDLSYNSFQENCGKEIFDLFNNLISFDDFEIDKNDKKRNENHQMSKLRSFNISGNRLKSKGIYYIMKGVISFLSSKQQMIKNQEIENEENEKLFVLSLHTNMRNEIECGQRERIYWLDNNSSSNEEKDEENDEDEKSEQEMEEEIDQMSFILRNDLNCDLKI